MAPTTTDRGEHGTAWWSVFLFGHVAAVVLDETESWADVGRGVVLVGLAGLLLVAPPRLRRYLDVVWIALSTILLAADLPSLANHRNLTLYVDLVVLAAWLWACARERRWRAPDDALFNAVAPVLRASVVVVYFFAGFHKLNRDFLFEPDASCAGWFATKLARVVLGAPLSLPVTLVIGLAVLTVAWELGLALGLSLSPLRSRARIVALCAAWALHSVLAMAVFYDFSALMFALLWAFVPRDLAAIAPVRRALALVLTATLVAGGVFWLRPDRENVAHVVQGGLLVIAQLLLVVPIVRGWSRASPPTEITAITPRALWIAPALLALFAASNYLGLRTAGTFSMFSNLRTEAGVTNHLLVPADHPLVWADYQRDVVWIETIDPGIEEYEDRPLSGLGLPRFELARLIGFWRAEDVGPVRARLRDARGDVHEVMDLTRSSEWTPTDAGWQSWLLDFRPVQPDPEQPNACRW